MRSADQKVQYVMVDVSDAQQSKEAFKKASDALGVPEYVFAVAGMAICD